MKTNLKPGDKIEVFESLINFFNLKKGEQFLGKSDNWAVDRITFDGKFKGYLHSINHPTCKAECKPVDAFIIKKLTNHP